MTKPRAKSKKVVSLRFAHQAMGGALPLWDILYGLRCSYLRSLSSKCYLISNDFCLELEPRPMFLDARSKQAHILHTYAVDLINLDIFWLRSHLAHLFSLINPTYADSSAKSASDSKTPSINTCQVAQNGVQVTKGRIVLACFAAGLSESLRLAK
jgi:hypothetical protein